jgi:hypothetical protein
MTKTKTPFKIYVQRIKNHKENKVKSFHKENMKKDNNEGTRERASDPRGC